jgi:type II secretory pathway component PulM
MTLHPRIRKAAAWTGVAAVLAGVFALYTQPGMAVLIAEQIWACFGR